MPLLGKKNETRPKAGVFSAIHVSFSVPDSHFYSICRFQNMPVNDKHDLKIDKTEN